MGYHRAFFALTALLLLAMQCVSATRSGVNCRALRNPISMASRLCLCEPCHVCAFTWTRFSCQLIVTADVDVSDGSEVKSVQPTLDPAAWFLNEASLTASRGGVQRKDISVSTEGNQVTTFSVGNEFFSSVIKDVQATTANDSVYLAAWSTGEVPFDPFNDKSGTTTGFKALFGSAIQRGVDFRGLVWQNLLERDQNLKMRDYINAISNPSQASKASSSGRFIFDDRLPGLTASHHQKTLVIRQKNELIAYVGGIDLTTDRWDTIAHNNSVLRKEAKIYAINEGWLDAHLRIQGPATLDVGANFLSRWNSKTPNSQDLLDDILQFENPVYTPLPPLNSSQSVSQPPRGDGTAAVQITRTYSCKYKGYNEFAPKGERSLLSARIQAIRQAKNFIFIEDQYFIEVPELVQVLLEVLPRIQRLIVVVQPTGSDTKFTGYGKYLFDMVAPLQKKFPNKLQLYTTKPSMKLYIHTKMVIIDDVFLSIGSANWNRRSMTSDSEIGANVVDRATTVTADGLIVAKSARDFRVRKFMEHTGKSYAEMDGMPFLQAASLLDKAALDPATILAVMEVQEKASYAAVTDALHDFADPDDSC